MQNKELLGAHKREKNLVTIHIGLNNTDDWSRSSRREHLKQRKNL